MPIHGALPRAMHCFRHRRKQWRPYRALITRRFAAVDFRFRGNDGRCGNDGGLCISAFGGMAGICFAATAAAGGFYDESVARLHAYRCAGGEVFGFAFFVVLSGALHNVDACFAVAAAVYAGWRDFAVR